MIKGENNQDIIKANLRILKNLMLNKLMLFDNIFVIQIKLFNY